MTEAEGYVPTLLDYARVIDWLCERSDIRVGDLPDEMFVPTTDAIKRVRLAAVATALSDSVAQPEDGSCWPDTAGA